MSLTGDKVRDTRANDGRGRDEGAKRRQILDGARDVFLADGFDAASMNEIARVAGVSKGTLYVYFASKDVLFAELIRQEKREQAEQLCGVVDLSNADIAAELQALGERLLERILLPSSVAHYRTVIAVAAKFPAVGQAFFEAGPRYGHARLADYFSEQATAGVIAIDDPSLAAWLFVDMCKSVHVSQALLCVSAPPSPEAIRAHVAGVLAVFLRAYPLTAKTSRAQSN